MQKQLQSPLCEEKISLVLRSDLLRDLDRQARSEEMSRSALVRQALRLYLKREGRRVVRQEATR